MSEPGSYGLVAEFQSAEALLDAVLAARTERDLKVDAYSPYPVPGISDPGTHRSALPRWVLLGAVAGGAGTYALEWYSAVVNYPINVGGRPTASWVAFLPPALEMCLLGAAVCGVLAMLIGSKLPRLHHPLFDLDVFERASSDRFFLVLRAAGDEFDPQRARDFAAALSPISISEVSL